MFCDYSSGGESAGGDGHSCERAEDIVDTFEGAERSESGEDECDYRDICEEEQRPV